MPKCFEGKKISQSINAPIIILSAPRAGSTLLFETLSRLPDLFTIGGESHALIEHIPALSTVARGYVSNRLDEIDATPEIIATLRSRFIAASRDFKGQPLFDKSQSFRLLEKTPKNALRIGFLNKVFPDAKFVFLVRDPRENISSIMQAWRSRRFVTYPDLPGWKGGWSLFLPNNWQSLIGESLAKVASYQWKEANQSILEGLEQIPRERKMMLGYQDLVANPQASLEAILAFAQLKAEAQTMLSNGLPLSRYTLTQPKADKWHANAAEILPYMSSISELVERLNKGLVAANNKTIDHNIDLSVVSDLPSLAAKQPQPPQARVSRNAPCPCGSGKKYRQCHGQLA
ncbi:sulfotransferase [Aliiglaciecola sp. LCG003]|uniref:sulfotransferase family protein n=1 Tax=Aliiglaciecola sp. LCG003 TaxID=3053655 RepID=UPI00257430BE|nr:sulfotransferase [Aliiglaciecola sp. LCG003]WJG08354.1 sulfotransferase [Aliiglaciecola sp. LCG003]